MNFQSRFPISSMKFWCPFSGLIRSAPNLSETPAVTRSLIPKEISEDPFFIGAEARLKCFGELSR